jgi:effector-binding domain-containing protein
MFDHKLCSVVTVTRQPTAAVKGEVPYARMREAHQAARAKLIAARPMLAAGATGLFVTRTGMPAASGLYMEIGLMVEHAFPAVGDVVPSELPAGRAAHFHLVGGFENLPKAWPFLMGWVGEQGLTPAGINWETYGETAADPAQQVTDLYMLLA